MAIQVRTFRSHTKDYKKLEEDINDYLIFVRKENVIDIKYTSDNEHVYAMVIVNEE